MDNAALVAITSLATAFIAGSITLLSKLIDTIQKKNEQSMVIRTTYINKRIAAAESYIARNSAGIVSALAAIRSFEHIKRVGIPFEQITEYSLSAEKKEMKMSLAENETLELYFDIKHLIIEYAISNDLLNGELDELMKSIHADNDVTFDFDEKVIYIIKLLK